MTAFDVFTPLGKVDMSLRTTRQGWHSLELLMKIIRTTLQRHQPAPLQAGHFPARSFQGTFSGVGFALPIDTVAKNVGAMIEEGYVSRPSIGVELAPDAMSESLGMPGAMVMKVVPGGPAQRAGMRPEMGQNVELRSNPKGIQRGFSGLICWYMLIWFWDILIMFQAVSSLITIFRPVCSFFVFVWQYSGRWGEVSWVMLDSSDGPQPDVLFFFF